MFYVKKKFRKGTITIIRYTKGGNILDSYPCHHCIAVMKKYEIKYVVYFDKCGKKHKTKVDDLDNVHVSKGVLDLQKHIKKPVFSNI